MKTLRRDLKRAEQIGLLGDVHADLNHVIVAISMLHSKGAHLIVQLGDFGLVWRRPNVKKELDLLQQQLRGHQQILLFVDGNHEDYDLLEGYPISDDGVRWVRARIGHLPRGLRAKLSHERTLAVLGGANSIDVRRRTPGVSWWEQEQITKDDLNRLGTEHADVLVSHDAPLNIPTLDGHLRRSDRFWDDRELAYAHRGREIFHRGFLQVRPRLSIGGHYHRLIDESIEYESPSGPFTSRVIVLDQQGMGRGNCAIFTPQTLGIDVFDINGKPFPEGDQHGN